MSNSKVKDTQEQNVNVEENPLEKDILTMHLDNGEDDSTLEADVEVEHGEINNVFLLTYAKFIASIVVLVAIYLYWVGHNAPGGGFIAGLMTSGALVLLYITYGKPFADGIKLDFKYLIPTGLTIALLTGLGGVMFGKPFLTHTFGHFDWPFIGEIELATAAIFDLGVYFVVVGTVMTIIMNIGKSQQ